MTERILITGSTGFIGGHLVGALAKSGCELILASRAKEDLTDRQSVRRTLQKSKPAIVLHLAGTRARETREPLAACMELNYKATVRLIEEALRAGARRIVTIGSAEEYGQYAGPLSEDLPLKPATPYGISKAKVTEFAAAMHAKEGWPIVVARPFSVYGPGQPPDMFVAEAVDSAVRNTPFKMTTGTQRRDLIYIDDLVTGLVSTAFTPGLEGGVFNLGTGQGHRLREVAERVWAMTGTNAPLEIGARPAALGELFDTCADVTRANQVLGWAPRVDLDRGLRQTIDQARTQVTEKVRNAG